MSLTLSHVVLALVAVALLGGAPPLLQRWSPRALHGLVALSTGVFLGTLLHVLGELFGFGHAHEAVAHPHDHAHGHVHDYAHEAEGLGSLALGSSSAALWTALALGFLVPYLLHRAARARHAHGHDEHAHADAAKHRFVLRASYLGLALHALLAGVGLSGVVGESSALTETAASGLVIAFLAHKGIETFSLGTLMRLAELTLSRAFAWLFAFAWITPAGLWLGSVAFESLGLGASLAAAFSAGTFLFVTAVELLPESFHGAAARVGQTVRIAVGAAVALLLPVWLESSPDLAQRFVLETAGVFAELAPFLMLGFLVAGILSQWLNPERMRRWLAKDDLRSVAVASVAGAPLPLCSCSVVPVAAALRGGGASRGATSAFLIATPETGVDSIAATYAVMDPVMTVARPVAAVSSAFVTGAVVSRVTERESGPAPVETSCCHAKPEPPACHAEASEPEPERPSFLAALRYGYVDLVDDLAWPLVLGVLASGLLAVALPQEFFEHPLFDGPLAYVLMLAVGLPIYVCAAASTPVAATLIAKGLAPGAALVFLLASPATNIGSLLVVRRLLGVRPLVAHLITLSLVTLACGVALDLVYGGFGIEPRALEAGHHHLLPAWLHQGAAVALGLCLLASFARKLGVRSTTGGNLTPASAGS